MRRSSLFFYHLPSQYYYLFPANYLMTFVLHLSKPLHLILSCGGA